MRRIVKNQKVCVSCNKSDPAWQSATSLVKVITVLLKKKSCQAFWLLDKAYQHHF